MKPAIKIDDQPGGFSNLPAQNMRRVLIVDDEEHVLELLKNVLEQDGFKVTAVSSAEQAWPLHQQKPYELVITDVRLGGMDGFELMTRIKNKNEETEVIIITSYASMESAIEAIRHGAYDYITKPFEDLDVISVAVERAFEKIDLKNQNRELMARLTQQNAELRELNARLNQLANTDGLTGLYNHRYFQEVLEKEVMRSSRHSREFALLFLDIDNFKNYNDEHGHVKGDQVLQRVAENINSNVRHSDIVARYGGEEFVIILPETGEQGALMHADNIRKAIEERAFNGKDNLPATPITISIGIAIFPVDGATPSALIKASDNALYEAKAQGKNKVCYLKDGCVKPT
jgi:diguanylate cyclase (GGDEF)-like protein